MTTLSKTAHENIRTALVEHIGSGVHSVEARKGIDYDDKEVVFVDVALDPDADVSFSATIGAEEVVKRSLNGECEGLFPMMSFYEDGLYER